MFQGTNKETCWPLPDECAPYRQPSSETEECPTDLSMTFDSFTRGPRAERD